MVASVGVAAVAYACGGSSSNGGQTDASQDVNVSDVVANLVAPDAGEDVNQYDVVANLVAPDSGEDAAVDATEDVTDGSPLDVVANLVPPDSGP